MTRLPNLLTSLRLVLALLTFFGLAGAALLSDRLPPETQFALERWAVFAFVIAAITDFFDGWLARKLHAESLWGSVLDPIADKVLVCGAILGLLALAPNAAVAIPAGPDPVPRVHRQRPARSRRAQGRHAAGDADRQVEDHAAAGRARRRAGGVLLGRLRPARRPCGVQGRRRPPRWACCGWRRRSR